MTTTPRVLFLCGDETGCSLWRVWQPCTALEQHGFVAEWCHKDDSEKVLPLVASGRYNMIITPRVVWPVEGVGEQWINAIHKAGLCWLYEVDDDIWSPGITNRQIRLFESERLKGVDQLEWERIERIRLLQRCDGLIVSSPRLKTIAQQLTDTPVIVVPNAIDARWFKQTLRGCDRIPDLKGKLTVGWAGGTREDADLAPLVEAWGILARRYPAIHFVVQGHISQALADAVPHDRRVTLPWLPLEEYPRGLLNIDIGCCSVAPLVFNTAKTCIKWYEMTLAGAACVVSPTLYGREVTDGENALVAETAEQWVVQLSRLIEDEQLRRTMQRNARRTVMTEHSLENNWQNWPLAWAEILEQFRLKQARRLVLATV